MIRIDLGSQGLSRARFAMSPLDTATDVLLVRGRRPHALSPRWRARVDEVLRTRQLGLLAVICGGGPLGYVPDFPRPELACFQPDVDTVLHRVATTSAERLRFELASAVGGHSWDPASDRKAPRLLLAAMEQGESHVAQLVADQLEQFWTDLLAPDWHGIRARLEGDVAARSTTIVREGLASAVGRLSPNMTWQDGRLEVDICRHDVHLDAEEVIFAPSIFVDTPIVCAGEPAGVPDPRAPLVIYPAIESESTLEPTTDELIGTTRTQILAQLTQPRTTAELAEHLGRSAGTISYHLQILYRAGLLRRSRSSHRVLYQRIPRPAAL
ncbi:helix-turn-helix domain-containing protein [Kitasatospora sp. NPDC002227]|uniref:helix-turn-helix domain-containing protein n=1 Tax=Kitasatospora sp. NPDC002227 TaxID=3154773 RepID=UPI0033333EC0